MELGPDINVATANGTSYDSLIANDAYQEQLPLIGRLASSWEVSSDGLVFTFRLRPNVKFHNGQSLTAEDVVYTFTRYTKPPEGLRSAVVVTFNYVEKMEVVDPLTVRMTTKFVKAAALNRLTGLRIYSKSWIEGGADNRRTMNGTGPFKLKNWTPGSSVELVKNPTFWDTGLPYLDGVTLYVLKDTGTRLAALRTGRVLATPHNATSLNATDKEALEKTGAPVRTWPNKLQRGSWLAFNTKASPFDDARVRRAVNIAVDRKLAVDAVYNGAGRVGYMFTEGNPQGIPLGELLTIPGFRTNKELDRTDAKNLLKEAGYPQGFKTTIQTRAIPIFTNDAVFLADQLQTIGITATVEPLETSVFFNRLGQGTFVLGQFACLSNPTDNVEGLSSYIVPGGSLAYQKWDNPTYSDLLSKQDRELDVVKRSAIVKEMERLLLTESPVSLWGWQFPYKAAWLQVRNWPTTAPDNAQGLLERVWLSN